MVTFSKCSEGQRRPPTPGAWPYELLYLFRSVLEAGGDSVTRLPPCVQQASIFRRHHRSPRSPTSTQVTRRDFCRSGTEPAATYTHPLPHRVGQQTITPQFITLAELYELLARIMVSSTRSGINHFSHKLRGMACYEITPDTNLMKM